MDKPTTWDELVQGAGFRTAGPVSLAPFIIGIDPCKADSDEWGIALMDRGTCQIITPNQGESVIDAIARASRLMKARLDQRMLDEFAKALTGPLRKEVSVESPFTPRPRIWGINPDVSA